MTTPATDKQIIYLADLKARFVASHTPLTVGGAQGARWALMYGAWALSLPTPATAEEASEQIDALKDGTGPALVAYAKAHKEWAMEIGQRVNAVNLDVADRSKDWPAFVATSLAMVEA